MKLNNEQFYQQTTLAPIYLLSGDEWLLRDEAKQYIISLARKTGFDTRLQYEMTAHFNWSQFSEILQSTDLFAERQIIELNLKNKKPGTEGSRVLENFLSNTPSDKILILLSEKLDASAAKAGWVTLIANQGSWLPVWPLRPQEYAHWLQVHLDQHELILDKKAKQLLTEKTEGNLLAAVQEIEKLSLLYEKNNLTETDIKKSLSNYARYTIFDLSTSWLSNQTTRYINILEHLKEEATELTLILWALQRDCQMLLKQKIKPQTTRPSYGSTAAQQALYQQHLSQHTISDYQHYFQQLCQIERAIKGLEKGNPWDLLREFMLQNLRKKK